MVKKLLGINRNPHDSMGDFDILKEKYDLEADIVISHCRRKICTSCKLFSKLMLRITGIKFNFIFMDNMGPLTPRKRKTGANVLDRYSLLMEPEPETESDWDSDSMDKSPLAAAKQHQEKRPSSKSVTTSRLNSTNAAESTSLATSIIRKTTNLEVVIAVPSRASKTIAQVSRKKHLTTHDTNRSHPHLAHVHNMRADTVNDDDDHPFSARARKVNQSLNATKKKRSRDVLYIKGLKRDRADEDFTP